MHRKYQNVLSSLLSLRGAQVTEGSFAVFFLGIYCVLGHLVKASIQFSTDKLSQDGSALTVLNKIFNHVLL